MTDVMTAANRTRPHELPTELLERFRSRAGELDATNSYCIDDINDLRQVGYQAVALPEELGGWGWDLGRVRRAAARGGRAGGAGGRRPACGRCRRVP